RAYSRYFDLPAFPFHKTRRSGEPSLALEMGPEGFERCCGPGRPLDFKDRRISYGTIEPTGHESTEEFQELGRNRSNLGVDPHHQRFDQTYVGCGCLTRRRRSNDPARSRNEMTPQPSAPPRRKCPTRPERGAPSRP